MTFETFAATVKEHAPSVAAVSRHGGTANRVEVIFSGGCRSYRYGGAYIDILRRLGVNVYTVSEVAALRAELATAEQRHGKRGLFGGTIDNTNEIKRLSAEIEKTLGAVIVEG